jgi:hypothetical protein
VKAPNYRKQLALAIVLFALASLAYWLEYARKPKEEAARADEKKIFSLKGVPVAKIRLEGKKPDESYVLRVLLECASLKDRLCKPEDTSKWTLAEPLRATGDDNTINSLLRNFGNLTTSDSVDLSSDAPEKRKQLLADYGLSADQRAKPETRKISLELEDGRRVTAYFGEKVPIGDGVFTVVERAEKGGAPVLDDSRVQVVPDWQLSVFGQKTSYFRDKKLMSGNEREVTSFVIAASKRNPGARIEAQKAEGTDRWTLKSGARGPYPGDLDTIEGVLSGALLLTAKDHVAENKNDATAKKALAGAKLAFDLAMRTKDGEKRLKLYEKPPTKKGGVPTVYATIEGLDPLVEVEPSNLDKLDQKLDDLRLKKMIAVMDRYGIDGIEAEVRGKRASKRTWTKKDQEWKSEDGKPGPKDKLNTILDRLSSSIVRGFGGPAPGADTLVLRMGNPEKPLAKGPAYEIELWKVGNRLYARDLRTERKEIVELAGDFASQLPWDDGFVKNP